MRLECPFLLAAVPRLIAHTSTFSAAAGWRAMRLATDAVQAAQQLAAHIEQLALQYLGRSAKRVTAQ